MENWPSPELVALIRELGQPDAYVGLLLIAAAFPFAWGVPRLVCGPVPHFRSVVFGGSIFDGVLFPAVWLGLTWLARALCDHAHLPLAFFTLAIPILVSRLLIRFIARVTLYVFPTSDLLPAIERTASWLAWVGVLLWIAGLLPSVLEVLDDVSWKMGSGKMSLATLLSGVLVTSLALMLTLWISAAIESRLLVGAKGQSLSLRKAAADIVRATLVLVGLLVALSAVGIDLTTLSVLGGAIGVGLGFGLQKLAANYVSGFVILTERALRIGDTVKIDGFEGRITDIATRYTVLRALNGRESIVPNEMLITQRVESATLADPRVALSTKVQVEYGSDLDKLIAQILVAVPKIARVILDPKPSVELSSFAADGLELTVWFWISDPENGSSGVRSEVNLALLRLFSANQIEIPYPQRMVRMAPPAGGSSPEGVVPSIVPLEDGLSDAGSQTSRSSESASTA